MVSFGPQPDLEAIDDHPLLELAVDVPGEPPLTERGRFGFDQRAMLFVIADPKSKLWARLGDEAVPVRATPIDASGKPAAEPLLCEAKLCRGSLEERVPDDLRRKYWMFWWQTFYKSFIIVTMRGHAEWMASMKDVDLNATFTAPWNAQMEAERARPRPYPPSVIPSECSHCGAPIAGWHSFCPACNKQRELTDPQGSNVERSSGA